MDKKEYRKQYYLKNRDLIIKRSCEWRENNRERYQERMVKYYIKRREALKEYSKENYHSRSLVSRWAYHTIRAHEHRGIEVNISRERLIEIADSQYTCQICGTGLKFYKGGRVFCKDSVTLDRLDNGLMFGKSSIDESNMLLICSECNMTKGTRKFIDFIAYCKMVVGKDWSRYGV